MTDRTGGGGKVEASLGNGQMPSGVPNPRMKFIAFVQEFSSGFDTSGVLRENGNSFSVPCTISKEIDSKKVLEAALKHFMPSME